MGSLASGTKGDVYLSGSSSWSYIAQYLDWVVPKLFLSVEISEEGENPESELKTQCCF